MYWIESISPAVNGQLELVGRTTTGEVARFSPREFPHRLGGGTRGRTTITSRAHEVISAQSYLNRRGWGHLDGSCQRLHRFYVPGMEVWIPSQAIFKMFFANLTDIYERVFTGRSLYEIAAPGFGENPMALTPGWTARAKGCREHENSRSRLYWLQSSMSAARSCRGIFRSALDNVLDVQVPSGQFDVHLRGKRDGNTLLVTRVTLASVVTDDIRLLDGTPVGSMKIDVASIERSNLKRIKRGFQHQRVKSLDPWRLTESQFQSLLDWMFLNGVLHRRATYTEEHERVLRRHLELLRARFLGKLEWNALPCTAQELACAQARYYKLRRTGLWQSVSKELMDV